MLADFQEAMEGVKKHLLKRTEPNKFLFIGELTSQVLSNTKIYDRLLDWVVSKNYQLRIVALILMLVW